jgi:hypothetical protein
VVVPLAVSLAYTIKAIPDDIAKISIVESNKSLTFLSSQITSFLYQSVEVHGAIKEFFRIRPDSIPNPMILLPGLATRN